jgi:hypothetical protein
MFVEVECRVREVRYTAMLNTEYIVEIVPDGNFKQILMADGNSHRIDLDEYEYLLTCLDVAGLVPEDVRMP